MGVRYISRCVVFMALAVAILAFVGMYMPSVLVGTVSKVLVMWNSDGSSENQEKERGIWNFPFHLTQTLMEDYSVDASKVYKINKGVINILNRLTKKPFLRYYKLNLNRKCTLFSEAGFCVSRSCGVDPCKKEEFLSVCKKREDSSKIDQFVDYSAFHEWKEENLSWTTNGETPSSEQGEMTYVDLEINPEQDTGYSGASASRIWKAIYDQNCFVQNQNLSQQHEIEGKDDAECEEKSLYYNLISGLHASISIHIAQNCLVEGRSDMWYPNSELFYEKVGKYPRRAYSLYVVYLVITKAFFDAGEYIEQYDYDTTEQVEAIEIKRMVQELRTIISPLARRFDIQTSFFGEDEQAFKRQLIDRFQNISHILDCISCERCKLWGKLQVHGLGIALKILFDRKAPSQLNLTRTEIVAFINLYRRVSESVDWFNVLMGDYKFKHTISYFRKSDATKQSLASSYDRFVADAHERLKNLSITPKIGISISEQD
ncbi:uncharacterized protein LOC126323908 isoform X1 [Schistocerca gregaria]|uniref:uncharacterized protein LOC126323908 isoform X1 n=1 Tax=Schistocerca gregaria TaxID=7010 RepID=UPI00211EA828|nr:uncharacterized protein LOC126323908 isoform X1 [Schistocerca gregaria]XP_049850782.1 uncharacterized protein LOC126323908 isoform X1 [Schistocerca gregaria]